MKRTLPLFLLVLATSLRAQNITSDLVLCLPLDATAQDMSGYANHGVISGATPTVNRFGTAGKAMHFNGTSNFITIPNSNSLESLENNSELTISAWCQPTAWYPTWNIFGVIEKYNPVTDYGWALAFENPSTNGNGNDVMLITNYPTYFETSTAVSLGQWAFYTVTYSKSLQTLCFYKNGQLMQTLNNSGQAMGSTNSGSVYIGYSPVGIDEYSQGDMDDIRLYKRALNAAEVLTLYNLTADCANAVGIAEQRPDDSNITLYPNPARNKVTLRGIQTTNFTILNALGQRVNFACEKIDGNLTLDIREWEKGIYYLLVAAEAGQEIKAAKLLIE